jgi:predicted membrane protein
MLVAMLIEGIGILAGVFVILAFYARTARSLRIHAIISNVLFLAYAILAGLVPVLLLHAILLPLNLKRLQQIERKVREARRAMPPVARSRA